MKKSLLVTLMAAVLLSSCGTISKLGPSSAGQQYVDGIYGNTPSFKTKEEKVLAQVETEALVEKTKGSVIYLFGDKKDSVFIPKDMSAKIQFSSDLGTTVTVSEYDWRYDNSWAFYSPYSLWGPWHSSAWAYNSWYYRGYPWHYGSWHVGWYDPWYYSSWGWFDPWWHGGWWGPHYAGWYGGWDPFWPYHPGFGYYPGHHHGNIHHHHKDVWRGPRHETGVDRVFAGNSTSRRGLGTSSSTPRNLTSTNRSTVTRSSSAISSGRAVPARRGTTASSSTVRNKVSTGSQSGSSFGEMQTSGRNYRRPAPTSSSGRSSGTTYGQDNTKSYQAGARNTNSSGYSRSQSSSSYERRSTPPSNNRSSFSTGTSRSSFSGGGSYGGGRSSGGSSGGASRSGGARR